MPTIVDEHEAQLETVVNTNQHYVDNLFAALDRDDDAIRHHRPHLTKRDRAKLETSLAQHLDKLARVKRALDAYRANPDVAPVERVEIGPAPLPNLHAPHDRSITYACPDGFDAAEFEGRYGYSIQTALSKVVTSLLRPNYDRWQQLVSTETKFDQNMANYYMRGDITKLEAVRAYFAGGGTFETNVLPYLAGWEDYLGCVDIDAIHDLGVQS